MNKVLVLGSSGMLGHVVSRYLKTETEHRVVNVCRKKLYTDDHVIDVEKDLGSLVHLIGTERPDFIVNCIGVLIKDSEMDHRRACFINSYLPHYLAGICRPWENTKIIHISTDCVFSGDRGKYGERDLQDGKDFYARSKALGELDDRTNLTLRTSIIGPELKANGTGLFHWFCNPSQKTVNGYTKTIWNGITTYEMARCIVLSMTTNLTGIYNLVPDTSVSKYQLLHVIKHVFDAPVEIKEFDGLVCDKTLVNSRKDEFD
jgi:dTDP-4-dehydrorhamnose reductase